MYAGEFETAIEEANLILEERDDEMALLVLALSHIGLDDIPAARETYRRLAETSDEGASLAAMGEADLAMYRGRARSAVDILRGAIADDEVEGRTTSLALKHVALAEAYQSIGDENPRHRKRASSARAE